MILTKNIDEASVYNTLGFANDMAVWMEKNHPGLHGKAIVAGFFPTSYYAVVSVKDKDGNFLGYMIA